MDLLAHPAHFACEYSSLLNIELPDTAVEDSVSNLPLWREEKKQVRDDTVFASGAGFLAVEENGRKLEACENGNNRYDDPK